MSLLMSIGLVVQVLSAIALIVLVLLQHGKGADLGAAFGSGASGSIFGAAGSGITMPARRAITAVCSARCPPFRLTCLLRPRLRLPPLLPRPLRRLRALLPRLRLPPIRLILGITLPPLPKTKFLGKITILRDAQNKTAQNVLTI